LKLLSYLSPFDWLVHFNQEMELANTIQILSYGILSVAGVVVMLDFVKARQELSRAMTSWRVERKDARGQ